MKKQTKAKYYYDYSKVFSFGKNNILVIGTRGHGKSYGIKDIGLKYSVKIHELGMVWIRRYDDDIKRLKPRFLTDWLNNVPELTEKYAFYQEGDFIYCEDKKKLDRWTICEFLSLNGYEKQKSIPRPFVKYIVYDEFITQKQYLSDECFFLEDLKESIVRDRTEYFVILLANSITTQNPILEGFEITPRDFSREFTCRNNFVLHYDSFNEDWKAHKRETSRVMFTKQDYTEYSIEAKFILDDISGVEEPPKGAIKNFQYNVVLNGLEIGVWLVNGIYFMGEPVNGNGTKTYSPNANDCFSKNYQYMDLKNLWWRHRMEDYVDGRIKFKTLKIKNAFMDVFLSINRKF